MNCIITGGSGFIGQHLIESILSNEDISRIIILDNKILQVSHEKVEYIFCDIREKIELIVTDYTAIYHLAALCKEPGYQWEEYFETNYIGTKNVIEFAKKNNIHNIIFTSTMMVFKAGENRNTEDDLTAPDTAYGISKLLAEEVLLNWENSNSRHRLRIVRAGVVFGRGENGNYTRLAKALNKNLFVYVGKKNTIKGSVYVKDVVNFLQFLNTDNNERIIYNFVFPQPDTIESICESICTVMGWKRFIPTIPYKLALFLSYLFELLDKLGLKNPVHHRRIEKLYHSTHLSADSVINSGFKYSYTLKSALEDWKRECNNAGLF